MPPADFAALVIHLKATQPLTIHQHMGRAVQQLCLNIVARSNPTLATSLHQDGHAAKPYAVSGLLRPGGTSALHGSVPVGANAWVRMVGLRRDVVATLDAYAAAPAGAEEIDRIPWAVERITWDDPWAGRASAADLIQQALLLPPLTALQFTFAAPTCFHSDDLAVPLPIPTLVFSSLQTRWTTFMELPLPEMLPVFARWWIAITQHRIETHSLKMKQGSLQTGFTGTASFAIVDGNAQLVKTQPEQAAVIKRMAGQLSSALRLLSMFAFFSGVGIKTTAGMGMCRPIFL